MLSGAFMMIHAITPYLQAYSIATHALLQKKKINFRRHLHYLQWVIQITVLPLHVMDYHYHLYHWKETLMLLNLNRSLPENAK